MKAREQKFMTVPVPLTADEQAALLAQAKAQGVSVDSLLRKAVLQIITAAPEVKPDPQQLSAEEWEKALDEWVESSPEIPHLPDEALRRESIYRRD
jgi:hypothetical protein